MYLIEGTAALNVSIERLNNMGCGRQSQSEYIESLNIQKFCIDQQNQDDDIISETILKYRLFGIPICF